MDNNLVGQTIQGRYYVVKQLGRGGVGVTFLAQDQQCFDSQCVVKQLKPKTTNPQALVTARKLFIREAEIMNRLGHCDRIPRLLAYFEQDQEFFLVQELIEGHDLSQEIFPGQPWSESKTLTLLQDALEVLLMVQQNSVIHRDLKPSNLMRRSHDNKIVLIDFGSVKQVSKQIVDDQGEIKQTVVVGTKSYMPTEQLMGRPGFYSDIYALGIIAIQALTGVEPKEFAVDDNSEIIWRSRLDRQVHYQPRFLDLLDKMVCYRHQDRYQSAGDVLSDLKQLDAEQNNDQDTLIIPKNNSQPAPEPFEPVPNLNQTTPEINNQSAHQPPLIKQTKPINNASQPNTTPNSVNQSAGKSVTFPRASFKPTAYKSSKSIRSSNRSFKSYRSSRSKSPLFLLFLCLLILLIAGAGWFFYQHRLKQARIALSPYENSSQGFRVSYPQSWSKQNRDDFLATGVVFFSPLENNEDQFKEQISVLVEDLGKDMPLVDYTKQSLAEIKQLSDPDIGEAQVVTMGANEGRQIVYRGEENGHPVKRMQTWSVKGSRAYVITYTAEPENYNDYLPTVAKIITSFETIKIK